MSNNAICAELLYIIANYEKGKIYSDKMWRKKYTVALNESVYIMKILISITKDKCNISDENISLLREFIIKNNGIMYIVEQEELTALTNELQILLIDDIEYECTGVVDLMERIIDRISLLLCTRERNYKQKIAYLLRGLHNLPRSYFSNHEGVILDLNHLATSLNDALEWSEFWLEKERIL